MYPPWNFEDGPSVAVRIRTTYAAWLLEHLPSPPEFQRSHPLLVEGYRTLTDAMVYAARQHQHACSAGAGDQKKLELRRQARALRVVWELAHRYLVALEMRRLTAGNCPDLTDRVLLAEHTVEGLVADVGMRL